LATHCERFADGSKSGKPRAITVVLSRRRIRLRGLVLAVAGALGLLSMAAPALGSPPALGAGTAQAPAIAPAPTTAPTPHEAQGAANAQQTPASESSDPGGGRAVGRPEPAPGQTPASESSDPGGGRAVGRPEPATKPPVTPDPPVTPPGRAVGRPEPATKPPVTPDPPVTPPGRAVGRPEPATDPPVTPDPPMPTPPAADPSQPDPIASPQAPLEEKPGLDPGVGAGPAAAGILPVGRPARDAVSGSAVPLVAGSSDRVLALRVASASDPVAALGTAAGLAAPDRLTCVPIGVACWSPAGPLPSFSAALALRLMDLGIAPRRSDHGDGSLDLPSPGPGPSPGGGSSSAGGAFGSAASGQVATVMSSILALAALTLFASFAAATARRTAFWPSPRERPG
jgi:hypothetical protein